MANTRKASEKTSEKNKLGNDKCENNTPTSEMTLASIKSDLNEIKESLQKSVKTGDLEGIVTNIVKGLLKNAEEQSEKRETVLKQKIDRLSTDVDRLTMENETLREKLCDVNKNTRDLQNEITEVKDLATFATVKANYNEQYSRKNNIKIYGVREAKGEKIVEVVKTTLKEKGVLM